MQSSCGEFLAYQHNYGLLLFMFWFLVVLIYQMEIVIDAKRFIFSPVISLVSFRIVEIGRKGRQSVDLKLQEAIWVISSCREIAFGGFRVRRWMSKIFMGREFTLSCERNRAGLFIQFDIFGTRRKLKTMIVPVGEEFVGIRNFSEALTTTTAGPARYHPVDFVHHQSPLGDGGRVEGSSYAEATVKGRGGHVESLIISSEGVESENLQSV